MLAAAGLFGTVEAQDSCEAGTMTTLPDAALVFAFFFGDCDDCECSSLALPLGGTSFENIAALVRKDGAPQRTQQDLRDA